MTAKDSSLYGDLLGYHIELKNPQTGKPLLRFKFHESGKFALYQRWPQNDGGNPSIADALDVLKTVLLLREQPLFDYTEMCAKVHIKLLEIFKDAKTQEEILKTAKPQEVSIEIVDQVTGESCKLILEVTFSSDGKVIL